jgi:hypothetical protein
MNLEHDQFGGWVLNLTDRAFIEPIFEWSQLGRGYNWRTFHPIQIEYEYDGNFAPGWEATIILLGVGFRLRANDDWSKSEAGRRLLDVEGAVERGEYEPFMNAEDEEADTTKEENERT